MHKKKRTPLDAQQSHLWIIGGGIAGMAAAAFAIRDATTNNPKMGLLRV